jgi:hypothetical protein
MQVLVSAESENDVSSPRKPKTDRWLMRLAGRTLLFVGVEEVEQR